MDTYTVHNGFGRARDQSISEDNKRGGVDGLTPTVFIVDDDISVRESLDELIKTAGWQVRSFESAEAFLAQPRSAAPCCLILDMALPGLSGLELQSELTGRADMPIIFMTGHSDVPKTVRAMKAGAIEFLTKPIDDVALLLAIRNAIERSCAALRHDREMLELRESYSALTSREREVLALVALGLPNKLVGSELGISETTVKAHRGHVMRKMQAESLADLVIMATRLGLRAQPDAEARR